MSKMTKTDARRIVRGPERTPAYCVLSIKDLRSMIASIERQNHRTSNPEIACGVFRGDIHTDANGKAQVNLNLKGVSNE